MYGYCKLSKRELAKQNQSKWGLFMIYAGVYVISFIMVYLYIPETKGPEIGALFGDKVAMHLMSDG